MSDLSIPLEALPESLLGPVVEAAAAVLKSLEPVEIPAVAQPLMRFDRRGLAAGAARRQLLRTVDRDLGFRQRVRAALAERPEIAAAGVPIALDAVVDAALDAHARGDLAWYCCAQWACQPYGFEAAIGAVLAVAATSRAADDAAAQDAAVDSRVRELESLVARADAARADAEARLAGLNDTLRDARAERRRATERAEAAVAAVDRARASDLEALAVARAAIDTAQARANNEAARAKRLGEELAQARRELVEQARRKQAGQAELDRTELASLADAARRMADRLDAAMRAAQTSADASPSTVAASPPAATAAAKPTKNAKAAKAVPKAPKGRPKPALPGGVVADTPEGVAAMLRSDGVVLVVDGYNVSQRAWPEATASEQREFLARMLSELNQRLGCEVICCFDGDLAVDVRPVRRRGLEVRFSAPDQEADEIVVGAVREQPAGRPVVVASSDRWVVEHASHAGAVCVASANLVAATRAIRR